MNRKSVTLDEFIVSYPFWGEWEVSYTDGTHLPKNEYVKLGDITIDVSKKIAQLYPILPFTFQFATDREFEECFSELFCRFPELLQTKKKGDKTGKEQNSAEDQKAQVNRTKKIIRNELTDSIVRTGLLRPEFCLMKEQTVEMRFLDVMEQLSKSKDGCLIFVTDTSAMRRGAISFLHKTLPKVLIWTIVPVFVMTEVQRQVNELNKIWTQSNKPHLGRCSVLRDRPQVSCISRELNYIRQWRPLEILTTLPEHLGQSNGNSNIDRLIIECVKNLKRERGLQRGVYLITGDKAMASLATLENQGSLHIGVPRLDLENLPKVSSVRYDSHKGSLDNSYKRSLVLTPVHYLLWDLTQVFSTIRVENKERSCKYDLVYYSQARGGFFANDVMEIREV